MAKLNDRHQPDAGRSPPPHKLTSERRGAAGLLTVTNQVSTKTPHHPDPGEERAQRGDGPGTVRGLTHSIPQDKLTSPDLTSSFHRGQNASG